MRSAAELARAIVGIITTPPEDLGDGECLEAILALLEAEGHPTLWLEPAR